MLVARAQLDLVEELLAEFGGPASMMQTMALRRAQHIAIVTLLRSVGHVLQKVDADTAGKKAWLDAAWQSWKNEPIFRNFIDLNRNRLLKEFRGALDIRDPAIRTTAVVADPGVKAVASFVVDLDATDLVTEDGRPLLPLFRDAVAFWNHYLTEAENAFRAEDARAL